MKILRIGIAFLLLVTITFSADSSLAKTETKIVDAHNLNMRSGPGLTYDVLLKLKKGEEVEVVSTSGEWHEIKYANQTGWIASWLTKDQNVTAQSTAIVSQVDGLNVRSEASIGAAVLERMNTGDEAVMTLSEGDWARIEFRGTNGWVYKEYIEEMVVSPDKSPSIEQPDKTNVDAFTVAVDALNVRKKASLSSKNIGQIHKSETYNVKEIDGNWLKIELSKKKDGWVYSFHGHLSSVSETKSAQSSANKEVTIISNGTNIRQQPTTSSPSVLRVDAGQQFEIVSEDGEWFEIILPTNEQAYVAKWVVSTNESKTVATNKQPRVSGTLQGVTIVIDPGHGGNDRGTTGARGTDEKDITLPTAELLAQKLKAAGANVQLTRESDTYVTLRKRVAFSHQHAADAFLSIHYDATIDSSVSGFTTYYANKRQYNLAEAINNGLASTLSIRDRGAQPGDYFVLRENRQNAILIELGFLSNPNEENVLKTENFREQATHGIYNGLLDYFNTTIQN